MSAWVSKVLLLGILRDLARGQVSMMKGKKRKRKNTGASQSQSGMKGFAIAYILLETLLSEAFDFLHDASWRIGVIFREISDTIQTPKLIVGGA